MPKPVAVDPQRKAEALRLANEHGPAEASRRTGIPASTIRAWRWREREANPAASVASGDDVEIARLQRTARRAQVVVEASIERVNELLPVAKNVRDVSIAAGVLSDKAQQLGQVVVALEDRRMRLVGEQASTIAAVLRLFLQALGLPLSEPAAKIMRDLLHQAGAGDVLAVSPADAQPAAEALRQAIAHELRAEIEDELRSEHLALPPADEADALEPEQSEAVETELTVSEPDPDPVVDAEVVYDDRVPAEYLAGYKDERLARAAWEDTKRREQERERREGLGFGTPRQSRWKDTFSMPASITGGSQGSGMPGWERGE